MVKIALDFNDNEYEGVDVKEYYTENLTKLGFKWDYSSFGSIWVYELNTIKFNNLCDSDGIRLIDGISIELEKSKDFRNLSIYLEDLKYFEIHNEK